MGGRQSNAKTGPFIFQTVASQAPPIVATSWTAPKGMLKSMVSYSLRPKDLIIKGPKVVMPPLGTLKFG